MKTSYLTTCVTLLIAVLSVTSGCKSFMTYKYGMTNPKEETPERLISFLETEKFPVSDMYMFADSSAYFNVMRNPLFRNNFLSHMNFDRDGFLLQWDTARCQWAGFDLIKALNKDSSYQKVPGLKLDQILDYIRPFGPGAGDDPVMNHPDFTIIVTWAKFMGKYNYLLFDIAEAVKKNQYSAIRLIWLNIDMQEGWHLTKEQRLTFR